MPITYPNQRIIKVHREPLSQDFLGIKNENWQAAARDLRPHAMMLYFYLAANANNYSLALSPAAIRQAIGMARSTYNDQIQVLIDKGYLVHSHGNTYDFYEVTQRTKENANIDTALVTDCTNADNTNTEAVQNSTADHIEIDNKEKDKKDREDFLQEKNTYIPQVREITIKNPVRKPKKELPQIPTKTEFVF